MENKSNVSENTPQKIAEQHKKSVEFKTNLNLYEQTKKNERFMIGDQWLGSQTKSNLPLLNYNFIGRIVKYKESQILSNPLTAAFCAEGVPSFLTDEQGAQRNEVMTDLQSGNYESFNALSDDDKLNLTFSALSDYYTAASERLKLNEKYAAAAHNAAISGTGALYFYWDELIDTGLFSGSDKTTKIMGDVSCEVLTVEDQLDFYDPTETDINKQDYIIISKKITVSEAKRVAKINGVSDEEIQKITADTGEQNYAYQRDEDANDTVDRVTVFTKLFKKWSDDYKQFSIYAVRTTESVTLREEWDTGLTRYPIALFRWEERGHCIFGESEVTNIIPNQISVNRMITAAVWNAMLTGMPIMLVDRNIVQGEITNQPGQILECHGDRDVSSAATYLTPPSFSSALMNTSADIINNTMSNAGANDAALGELKSDNATAIIARREAATAPMQMMKNRYYQFVEDAVRILADMWILFYGTRKLKISDKQGNWYLPFEGEKYKNLVLSVKIDVGASTIWSQEKGQQILDNLFLNQKIDFIQYLDRIPKGLITDVQGLIDDFKRQQAQAQQQQQNIDNLGTDDFYGSLSPEEREQFENMSYEEQQALINGAKEEVRQESGM